MEDETPGAPKQKKNPLWLIVLGFITLLIAGYGLITNIQNMNKRLDDKDQIIQDTQLSLQQERQGKTQCILQADSLKKINASYSPYKHLVESIVQRDASIKDLKYRAGDQVILKRDSSKVVIQDIITGGSQYEYYVRYVVLYKDKSEETVKPELIY